MKRVEIDFTSGEFSATLTESDIFSIEIDDELWRTISLLQEIINEANDQLQPILRDLDNKLREREEYVLE
jgi:hypothetical protein